MTSPTMQPDPTPGRPYVYDHIPKLGPYEQGDRRGSLLPERGGIPGLTYYQVPVLKRRLAQDDGWLPIYGNAVYTIVGPQGEIDCELLGAGTIIKGVDPMAGKRRCLVDKMIFDETGLDPNTGWSPPVELQPETPSESLQVEDPSNAPERSSQSRSKQIRQEGRKGDARVQGGKAQE